MRFRKKETPPQDCLQAIATSQAQKNQPMSTSEGTLIEPHALFCDRTGCTVVYDTSVNRRFGTCSHGLGNDNEPVAQGPEPTTVPPIALGSVAVGLENYSVE